PFHFGQHFGELALDDLVVRNQFRAPAAERDRFEVGLEKFEVAGKRAADLMLIQERLPDKSVANRAEQQSPKFIDVALFSILRRKRFDMRDILLPPAAKRSQKLRMRGG